MSVKFTCEDGTDVTNDEELMILRRVNTFIDSHLAPNPNCKPGDSWDVPVNCVQEVFAPYVEGTYSGKATFVRKENEPNGDWSMCWRMGPQKRLSEMEKQQKREAWELENGTGLPFLPKWNYV